MFYDLVALFSCYCVVSVVCCFELLGDFACSAYDFDFL